MPNPKDSFFAIRINKEQVEEQVDRFNDKEEIISIPDWFTCLLHNQTVIIDKLNKLLEGEEAFCPKCLQREVYKNID